MQQHHVDIIKPQLFKRLFQRALRVRRLEGLEPQLGRDEQLAAIHAARLNGRAHGFLVAVGLRRVDQPVAGFDRLDHAGRTFGGIGQLEHAVAQRGHDDAVVERKCFHHFHPPFI